MMTSTAPSTSRAPLSAVSDNKRSAEDASTTEKSSSALSPYKERMKQLEDARTSTNADTKILMFLSQDILECIPGKLEELEVDEIEQLNDEEREAAYDGITQEQIDKYLQVMVVDRKLAQLQREYYNKIMFADSRNDEGEGIVMLNTYSSWCMYPVIQKLLTTSTKEINKAKKAVEAASGTTSTTKNMAVDAFNTAFATILACEAMDHWKMDTESPEDCEKISKKVSKVCSDLLWFDDAELGFMDPYSRNTVINKLTSIHQDWNDIGGVKFKTAKNGQGLGRSHAPPPATKKLKTTNAAVVATSTSSTSNSSGSNNEHLVAFLNAIQAKKKLREKTCVQLKIASSNNKSALVVLSGATDMKKINQLCAYVSGHTNNYEYHSQRGTCIKGSRVELELEGAKLWLAAKSLGKQAAKEGVAHVEDKQVKIIQVFQGLNTTPTSGVVHDSDQARNVKAYWVTPAGERFEITVQAIVPNKCIAGKDRPMPRLVKDLDAYTPNVRTGFGKGLYSANRHIQGNRQGPSYIVGFGTSQGDLKKTHDNCQSKPIANEDGDVSMGDLFFESYWKPENVATAGPPSV